MAIFQIVNGKCHWQTPFKSLDEVKDRFPPDCLFVDAPDYVNEQWGFDETEIGDDRFIKPEAPDGWIYDDETGQLMPEEMLEQALEQNKESKQNENNAALAKYLEDHPLTWKDGKQYGVTLQDQQEIALNILSYQMAAQAISTMAETDPDAAAQAGQVAGFVLEWHAVDEPCVAWTIEDMTALSIAIRSHIYPAYTLNQNYKSQIYACEDRASVNAIVIDYSQLDPQPEEGEEETTPDQGTDEGNTEVTTPDESGEASTTEPSTEESTDTPTA